MDSYANSREFLDFLAVCLIASYFFYAFANLIVQEHLVVGTNQEMHLKKIFT